MTQKFNARLKQFNEDMVGTGTGVGTVKSNTTTNNQQQQQNIYQIMADYLKLNPNVTPQQLQKDFESVRTTDRSLLEPLTNFHQMLGTVFNPAGNNPNDPAQNQADVQSSTDVKRGVKPAVTSTSTNTAIRSSILGTKL